MNTRNLTGMSANRISSECVILEYETMINNNDGSFNVYPNRMERKASVGILQPKEIERLLAAGIECRNGVTIAISEAPENQPDTIYYNGKSYRVLKWSFDFAYNADNVDEEFDEYDEYNMIINRYGSVIALCDEITLPAADHDDL